MGLRVADDPPLYSETHLFVCCNSRPEGRARRSCAGKGSERLRDDMKARSKELALGRVRVNSAGYLDRRELASCLVIYLEGVWYRITNISDIDLILERHVRDGGRGARALLSDVAS